MTKAIPLASYVLLASTVQAADRQVEDLLSHMRTAYRSIKAATFTTESKFIANSYTSVFWFESPSKMRVDITTPGKKSIRASQIRISNGETIFLKLPNKPEFNQEQYSALAFEFRLPANLESLCFFDWDQQLSTTPGKNMARSTFKIELNQVWNGKKWTVLQETAAFQRVVCRYFIDPKTFLIWRTITKSMPGGATTTNSDCWITKLNPSAKIDDGMFTVAHV